MKLHVFPASPNAKKVMIANELLELGCELVQVDLPKGVQRQAEFLALNPNGKVPVLEFDDGKTLWESNAIVNCLASQKDTDLWPKSNARYDIMRWQFWEACHWTPACGPYIAKHLFHRDNIDLEAAKPEFQKYATVLDSHLAGREWLATDTMTMADISVGAILCYRTLCHYPLDGFKNIDRWIARIEDLSAWQKANQS